jgi:TPR repeat protein
MLNILVAYLLTEIPIFRPFKYTLALLPLYSNAQHSNKTVEETVTKHIYDNNIQTIRQYLAEQEEKHNNPAAYFYHGYLYICGDIPKNAGLANFYFLKAIENSQHNVHIKRIAQKAIADSLYSGDGCEKSLKRAHDYYLASAKLGYVPAMFNVAITFKEVGNDKKYKFWMKQYNKYVLLDDSF